MATNDSAFKESGVWNVSNLYSEQIIFNHVIALDRAKTMAQIGPLDPTEAMVMNAAQKLNFRIEGLKYFHAHVDSLLFTTKFAIRNAGLLKIHQQLQNNIKEVTKWMELVESPKMDDKTHRSHIELNMKWFNNCYTELIRITEVLLPILYKENLIYQYIKQYSQKERKEDVMKRLVDGSGV